MLRVTSACPDHASSRYCDQTWRVLCYTGYNIGRVEVEMMSDKNCRQRYGRSEFPP